MTNTAKKALRENFRRDRKPAPKWDKSDLEAYYAGHDDARKAQDAASLSRLFNLAAKVPVLKEALDWAKEHDVDVIVDRTSRGVGGYYSLGSGIVVLSLPAFVSDATLAGVAVHEIRHAWQDHQDMIPTADYAYTDYNIKIALIEADATAHQRLAEKQARIAERQGILERSPGMKKEFIESHKAGLLKQQAEIADTPAFLWKAFRGWYEGVQRRSYTYGDASMKIYGEKLGIPGVKKKDYNFEFRKKSAPVTTGLDYTRSEQLRRLGKGFRTGNYFNAANSDELPRYMLSRTASSVFFSKGKYRPALTVNEIRRRELRLRAHKGKRTLVHMGE